MPKETFETGLYICKSQVHNKPMNVRQKAANTFRCDLQVTGHYVMVNKIIRPVIRPT